MHVKDWRPSMNGILLLSHSKEIVQGLRNLLHEIARDVPLTIAGGTDDGGIGSSYFLIEKAILSNQADTLYVFYDLGSTKINLEMVMENTPNKKFHIFDVPLIEGSYIGATLLQNNVDHDIIVDNLKPLIIK